MSEAKVSEWHVDRWGYTVRMFDRTMTQIEDTAAYAEAKSWSAYRVRFASSADMVRGTATSIADAMAKADAQLREWGLL